MQSSTDVFLTFFFNERKALLNPHGQWVQERGHPVGQEGGRRALFHLLLEAQVAGVATLLAVVDRTGMQVGVTPVARSSCRSCTSGRAGAGWAQ